MQKKIQEIILNNQTKKGDLATNIVLNWQKDKLINNFQN